eukprot:CAMPEP_0113464414 /NCGR_PEP_ID=MMETSP0014_2-20120614/13189_1 /TAXON_ID=2857 /ORGANISM="Nitzschia sp." /LENGTH=405 /DNA_ID=CAMNT_0000356495 /DNA_START=188 /DNA_END=1405 /DNA_ORIENTATION=+ /assembly_acc=CAM_ASM_000159
MMKQVVTRLVVVSALALVMILAAAVFQQNNRSRDDIGSVMMRSSWSPLVGRGQVQHQHQHQRHTKDHRQINLQRKLSLVHPKSDDDVSSSSSSSSSSTDDDSTTTTTQTHGVSPEATASLTDDDTSSASTTTDDDTTSSSTSSAKDDKKKKKAKKDSRSSSSSSGSSSSASSSASSSSSSNSSDTSASGATTSNTTNTTMAPTTQTINPGEKKTAVVLQKSDDDVDIDIDDVDAQTVNRRKKGGGTTGGVGDYSNIGSNNTSGITTNVGDSANGNSTATNDTSSSSLPFTRSNGPTVFHYADDDLVNSDTYTSTHGFSSPSSNSKYTTPLNPVVDDILQFLDDDYVKSNHTHMFPSEKDEPTMYPVVVVGIFVSSAIVLCAVTGYKSYQKRRHYTEVPPAVALTV